MLLLQCCLYGLSLLVLPGTLSYALPTSFYDNIQPQQLQQIEYQQLDYYVDIYRFSSQYSTHLLFDHLDGSLSSLSKSISLHFQDLVQVTTQSFDLSDAFVVDVELLKGQLQGAVGSFIEDSLPPIWNTRGNAIDKASLSTYIEQVTMQYCQPHKHSSISNECIEAHAQQIVSQVDSYIQDHLLSIIDVIIEEDLPPLFKTTQSHVNGILAHFSHYLHKKTSINTTTNTIVMYNTFENSNELASFLKSSIHLYHLSLEDSISLKKYTLLARVD